MTERKGGLMNFVLYLASRYMRFKASERGISAIAVIAFLTIVISAAAAVVILSAANGFHYSFIEKLMSKDAHVTIYGGENGISDYEAIIQKISAVRGVESAYPFFDGQALVEGSLNTWAAILKGVPKHFWEQDEDFQAQFKVMDGTFDLSERFTIALGENLALNLGVGVGSYVTLTVYDADLFSATYRFYVAAIFSAGYAEYDTSLAFISFEDAQEIFNSFGKAYGIAVKVDKPFEAERYYPAINEICPQYYKTTWKDLNKANLVALKNEKTLMMVILFVFFGIVFFNILATMIAMVLDRRQEVGILKAMGLKPNDTMGVFLFTGFLLGIGGSFLGVAVGLFFTISLNPILHFIEYVIDFVNFSAFFGVSQVFQIPYPSHFEFFKSTVYYITSFPIRIQYGDLVFIILTSVTVSTLAIIFPARQASKYRPVEVLRND